MRSTFICFNAEVGHNVLCINNGLMKDIAISKFKVKSRIPHRHHQVLFSISAVANTFMAVIHVYEGYMCVLVV